MGLADAVVAEIEVRAVHLASDLREDPAHLAAVREILGEEALQLQGRGDVGLGGRRSGLRGIAGALAEGDELDPASGVGAAEGFLVRS